MKVERPDDVPILLACAKRLRLAKLLDRHFKSGNRWQGELTFGEVVSVWLCFIISQGDHRLNELQRWAEQRLHTLGLLLNKSVRALDFQDDRLADILDRFSQLQSWRDFEVDLNQHTVRVYHLPAELFRIDFTTASTYADVLSEYGLIQFGNSKDDPDLPHIKVAVAALDPLGMPVVTLVVPGNRADDPLYVPIIAKVQTSFGQGGKTFVGDVKLASLANRAYLVATGEFYLCPLGEKQLPKKELLELLQPVWQGQQSLQRVYRPVKPSPRPASDLQDDPLLVACQQDANQGELVATGFVFEKELQAEVQGKVVGWTERRWLVRSEAFANGQRTVLQRRLSKAKEQIERLNQRKRGKKQLTTKQRREAVQRIIEEQQVLGLLSWQIVKTTKQWKVRGYKNKDARIEKEVRYRVEVKEEQEVMEQREREMGWRVYASNHKEMNLPGVVWGYRGQYRIEDDWARLKGQPLSLRPMYLHREERMTGLVLLLGLALRMLCLLEHRARKHLDRDKTPLRGVYAGQPGREAINPTCETLLAVFKGISLVLLEVNGQPCAYLSELTKPQLRILRLLGFPMSLYKKLASPISRTR